MTLFSVLVVIVPVRDELRTAVVPQDEGLLLVYPTQILNGAVPNHSFESVYGEGTYLALAAVFRVFGASMQVERSVGLLYQVILVASISLIIGRRRGLWAGALTGLVSSLIMVTEIGLPAISWMGALACGALALLMIDIGLGQVHVRRALLVFAGVFLGLAVSYRLDFAMAVCLVLAPVAYFRRRLTLWIVPGLIAGLLPLLVNLAQAGPAAVIRGQVIEPIFASGPGRHLPLSLLPPRQLLVLGTITVVAVELVAFGLVGARQRPGAWDAALLMTVGLFDVALLPETLQRSDAGHIVVVACFVLPSALLIPVARGWSVTLGLLVLLLIAPSALTSYVQAARRSVGLVSSPVFTVTHQGRSVTVNSAAEQKDLIELLEAVDAHSHPGEHVFVGPSDLRRTNYNDTFIYFLLPQLRPGSYYLEMEPGVANASNSRLASDLNSDQLLILTTAYDSWHEPNASTHYGSASANEVVASKFHEIGQWGTWHLLIR